jgi:hypothetical protein
MTTKLSMQNGEPFIAKLEEAMEANDADFLEANLPRLEKLEQFT